MSNSATELQNRLKQQREDKYIIVPKEEFDTMVKLANSANEEIQELQSENEDLRTAKEEMSENNQSLKEEKEDLEERIKEDNPHNLLDEQIVEAFKQIHSHQNTNQIKFLGLLQRYASNGYNQK